MPVAKHLSYAASRSRMERSRRIGRIDGPSSVQLRLHHDEAPTARPQHALSRVPAIAAAAVASRSSFRIGVQITGATGDILWAIASWTGKAMLDGCAAYAFAMYGIPDAIDGDTSDDAEPSKPSVPAPALSRPPLQVVSLDPEPNIRAAKILLLDTARPYPVVECETRSEQTSSPHSPWRAVIALALLLPSRIQKGYVRHQAIAELKSLDDRSLRDMGISRADIGYVARHGVRP